MKTTVVHCKKSKYDIYIGRPSKWGNPFVRGRDGSHNEVIQKYKEWVLTQVHLMAELKDLKGKTLGCFCSPYTCHGDILARLADSVYSDAPVKTVQQAKPVIVQEVKPVQVPAPPVQEVPANPPADWANNPEFVENLYNSLMKIQEARKIETVKVQREVTRQHEVAAKVKRMAARKTEKV